ncbi:hypothetical protein [Streptomyces sp. NPDC046870]|uniref:hypothetical protein n=1 Tax=Streptomyces sp. NPDC046870 TaxID=3155135 RepID=UPI00345690C5
MTLALSLRAQGADPMVGPGDIDAVREPVEHRNRLPAHPRHPYAAVRARRAREAGNRVGGHGGTGAGPLTAFAEDGTAAFAECRAGGVTAWGTGTGPSAALCAVPSAVNRAAR